MHSMWDPRMHLGTWMMHRYPYCSSMTFSFKSLQERRTLKQTFCPIPTNMLFPDDEDVVVHLVHSPLNDSLPPQPGGCLFSLCLIWTRVPLHGEAWTFLLAWGQFCKRSWCCDTRLEYTGVYSADDISGPAWHKMLPSKDDSHDI